MSGHILISWRSSERGDAPEIELLREKVQTGPPRGVMSLWEEQKDLRTGNYGLFGLANLKKGKYQTGIMSTEIINH